MIIGVFLFFIFVGAVEHFYLIIFFASSTPHPPFYKEQLLFQDFSKAELCHYMKPSESNLMFKLSWKRMKSHHHWSVVAALLMATCRKDGTLGVVSAYIKQLFSLFSAEALRKVLLSLACWLVRNKNFLLPCFFRIPVPDKWAMFSYSVWGQKPYD
jgi:hypothetical protein